MKKYIIIAGVNGAGKSTLYQMYDAFEGMPRVNVDELVRDIGDWKNQNSCCDGCYAKKIKDFGL